METIEIMVRNKVPRFKKDSAKSVITWNTGYIINFDFDEEWGHTKTLRVVNDKGDIIIPDIVFEGNSVELPKITDTNHIGIGVFSGNLSSTTKLILTCRKSILEDDGAPLPPTEDVYNQIMGVLNGKAEKNHSHDEYLSITSFDEVAKEAEDAYTIANNTQEEVKNIKGELKDKAPKEHTHDDYIKADEIDNALNSIIDIQNSYMGGDSV